MERSLGDLEQLVMLSLLRLGEEAYGVSVQREIATRAGRTLTFATIYTTLARLEAKGLVESRLGEPTPERGGRAKKLVRLTSAGRAELRQRLHEVRAMVQGLDASWSRP